MNERFKHLSLMAGGSHYPSINPDLQQKFAELIVRECASIADTERDTSLGCGYITKTKGMLILEHFGIEQ
jgi:hypothetical protein